MNDETIQQLNAINQKFYNTTAHEFSKTRGNPWPGWEQLLPYVEGLDVSNDLHVLDVGCGNGRFGVFLADRLDISVSYHGLDNNPTLLTYAQEALVNHDNISTCRLKEHDVVRSLPDSSSYDLVVAFGLIHHIPGTSNRTNFVRHLAQKVKPGGVLIYASWLFYEHDRFRQRIIPWSDDLKDQIEEHDYLLDWQRGEHAIRYCHYVDDSEQAALDESTGFEPLALYCADTFNMYSVLRNVKTV